MILIDKVTKGIISPILINLFMFWNNFLMTTLFLLLISLQRPRNLKQRNYYCRTKSLSPPPYLSVRIGVVSGCVDFLVLGEYQVSDPYLCSFFTAQSWFLRGHDNISLSNFLYVHHRVCIKTVERVTSRYTI